MRKLSYLIIGIFIFFANCELSPGNPEVDIEINTELCLPGFEENSLDIVTWNLQTFPLTSSTLLYIDDIITDIDADIIALQEIESAFALSDLVNQLPDWEGLLYPDDKLQLGFIYNSKKISISPLIALFTDDFSAFPRPAVMTTLTFKESQEKLYLINVHLKCCSGQENEIRRKSAAEKLKNYIDLNLSESRVIVLGDFNEQIGDDQPNSSFVAFIDDYENYYFADYSIAESSEEHWSYPAYPSHIDHILVTNELFESINGVGTILIDKCFDDYQNQISDHRPVYISIVWE